MGNPEVYYVKVKGEKARLFYTDEKNKEGRPIMERTGKSMDKGANFTVSATYKAHPDDRGNGVIIADDGVKYFFLGEVTSFFVRVRDVVRTDKDAPPEIISEIIGVYSVEKGDTLSGIAQHFYKNGDHEHTMAIFNANQHILKNPNTIFPGQELQIPKLK